MYSTCERATLRAVSWSSTRLATRTPTAMAPVKPTATMDMSRMDTESSIRLAPGLSLLTLNTFPLKCPSTPGRRLSLARRTKKPGLPPDLFPNYLKDTNLWLTYGVGNVNTTWLPCRGLSIVTRSRRRRVWWSRCVISVTHVERNHSPTDASSLRSSVWHLWLYWHNRKALGV